MGKRKSPTIVAELPGAAFLDDTAYAEYGDMARNYEKAVADFERSGDEANLWESLSGLGFEHGEIAWHVAHRGERMRQGYCS